MKDELVNSIQQRCISQGWTLSLAESCTGGHLAACLTSLAGCSEYFLGSIVAYSNILKMNVLNVDEHNLTTYGAVSGPVVVQMAQGILQLSGSDYSIGVSGIAGPGGGSSEKPIGTIWAAIAGQNIDPFIWTFQLSGTRQEIIDKSVYLILSQFWMLIK